MRSNSSAAGALERSRGMTWLRSNPESAGCNGANMKCLFLSYSVPNDASKPGVHVGRHLRRLGALKYQCFWVLPFLDEDFKVIKELMKQIEIQQRESLLMEGKTLFMTAHPPPPIPNHARTEDETG